MTYKYLFILLSCFILKQGLVAQVVPPPATQAEVDAGLNRFKYVTPYTLANSPLAGGPTNGITASAATNIAEYFSTNQNRQMTQFPEKLVNLSAGISNVVYLNSASNVVSALSNVVSGTRYVLAEGAEWQVRGNSVKSNGLAAINIFNKSNIEIVGYGATIYATNIGDVLFLTNCQNVLIEGLTVKGTVVTNYAALGAVGVVWGAVSYFACDDLRFYRNRIIDHHDHGIWDLASQGGSYKPATTNIQGRFNFFYNGGSMRTNESSSKDGTAIVPTGGDWTDNTIMYWMRGIEPYIENVSGSARAQNTLLARNRIVNCMDDAILTAGSTNTHGLIIEDNIIEWHPGATWRGSNFIVSATGININAGQRVKILRNKIYYAPNFDIDVPGNLEKFGFVIEDNFGYGYFYGASGGGGLEVTSSSAKMPNRGFSIKNNKFEFKRGFGIGLTGVRDSEISGNTLINTGLDSTRQMWIYSDATTICSNLVIFGNHITSDERDTPTANGIDIENLTLATVLAGNTIYGQATSVNNLAGAEVTQYNFDASSTNRFAAIRDLNTASNSLYSAISGGGGTPAGSDTSVQFNNAGSFGGDTYFKYDAASRALYFVPSSGLPVWEIGRSNSVTGFTNRMFSNGGDWRLVNLGSIDAYITMLVGTSFSGQMFGVETHTNRFAPNVSNALDLGNTNALWKDLRMTGNQYVGGTIYATGAVSVVGTASETSYLTLTGTNDVGVVTKAANSNSFWSTNIVGWLDKASASVIILDCNDGNKFQITNQLGQATSLIVTNLARGQEISISGDADGTSRVVTIIPQLGYLVRDYDAFGVAAATSKAITVTNGNTFEISILAKKAFTTNFADVVTRQAKY
jgi:hypothetical protein